MCYEKYSHQNTCFRECRISHCDKLIFCKLSSCLVRLLNIKIVPWIHMNMCVILWYGNPLAGKDGSDRIILKLITEKRYERD